MKKKDAQEPPKIEVVPERDSGVKDTNNPDNLKGLSEEIWEKMYNALYDYYFGQIDFLSLLDKWEEILQIKKHV